MSEDTFPAPRILVLRGGAIGDFVCTLPALTALRERWPAAYIELIGYPHVAGLAAEAGLVDRVRSLDQADVAQWFSFAPRIREEQAARLRTFDLVLSYLYDPYGTVRENMLAAGALQVLYGDPRVRAGHAVDHLLKPLQELAIFPEGDAQPRLDLGPDAAADGRRRLPVRGDDAVLLHPGSGSTAKNWPLARFLALAGRIAAAGLGTPVFLVGEADEAIAAELARRPAPAPVMAGLSLAEAARVLSACRAYVGNDSGMTHLAAALGLPTVALFGPSNPAAWGPRGRRVRIVRSTEPTTESLAQTEPETILHVLRALIGGED